MEQERYSAFSAMLDIFAAPRKAMEGVRGHKAWLWWPLSINLLLTVGVSLYYVNWVDFPWLIEETIRALPDDAPAEAAEGIRGFMSPARQSLFSVLGIVVITFLIFTIQAVYLNLISKLTSGDKFGFGDWFSFSAWTSFVGVLNAIIMFGVILTADSNQLPQQDLLPLSFNSLFIQAEPGEPWFNWGNSITLINVWMLVLMAIGYNCWTKASMVKSAAITWAPWVLVFGIWAALI